MALKVFAAINGSTYIYPDGPTLQYYYVLFQPNGNIIFHLGALGDLTGYRATAIPYEIGAHNMRIEDDGVVIFDSNLPAHWWNARWTFRPLPISNLPLKNTPAQLVAGNYEFLYGDTGCAYGLVDAARYTIMGPSSVTIYMPTTGERPDIGKLTDWTAWYMLKGDPKPMLQIAGAGSTCPLHFRDESTGKPISLLKYPQANTYDLPERQGAPWLPKGLPLNPSQPDGYSQWGGGWGPQQAHFCGMSYLAFMATQDPSFLEDLQYAANFNILTDATKSTANGAVNSGEMRGIGWTWRELFMAHTATLYAEQMGILPAGSHPSSYWKQLLDQSLAYYTKQVMVPANDVFRIVYGPPGTGSWAPWQADYVLTALAFGILTGHSDWLPLYLYMLKNVIDRTSNKTAYPPGWGTAYYIHGQTWQEAFDSLLTAVESGITQAQYDKLKLDPLNGGKAMQGNEYMFTTRAALVMADYLDKKKLTPIRSTYPEFDIALNNAQTMFLAYGAVNPRVSIISTGGIIMPSVTVTFGQTVPLLVTYVGGVAPTTPPTYTQTDASLGSLSDPNVSHVLFTAAQKEGKTTVTAAATGADGPTSGSCEVTVKAPTPPLFKTLTLTPGPIG